MVRSVREDARGRRAFGDGNGLREERQRKAPDFEGKDVICMIYTQLHIYVLYIRTFMYYVYI